MSDCGDEDYFVPLVDQRVFGAGIKRRRVAFVPATTDASEPSKLSKQTSNAGSKYLSIVMKDADKPNGDHQENVEGQPKQPPCPICGQPVSGESTDMQRHESSIAHQLCVEHSLPPSHLDRSHVGLRYMQGYGWDPDARKGLGARQEGIRIPIKATQKIDSAGLGLVTADEDGAGVVAKSRQRTAEDKQAVKLDARKVRKMEQDKSWRAERLRQSVYGEDLSQYLGENG